MNRCASRCNRHQGGDRLDHQDRHDQQVWISQLQSGDREIDADRQHGADHRLLQVGGELRRLNRPARDSSRAGAPRPRSRSANWSARPMARIGLMPVRVSVNLAARWRTSCRCSLACTRDCRTSPPNHSTDQQGDGNRDQQQLPGEQAQDGQRTPGPGGPTRAGWSAPRSDWPAASDSGPIAKASRPTDWRTK